MKGKRETFAILAKSARRYWDFQHDFYNTLHVLVALVVQMCA
jgi:hypothetical protein